MIKHFGHNVGHELCENDLIQYGVGCNVYLQFVFSV